MKGSIPLVFGGGLIFVIFLGMGLGGLDWMIHAGIQRFMVITEGTELWTLWTTMPIPIYMKFTFFNITNPQEFGEGAKAVVTEMGPYVYMEDWEKVNLSTNSEDETIRYKLTKTYYFQPHMSNGTEKDMVTFINVIFIAVAAVTKKFIDDEFMLGQMDSMLSEKGESLTKTATVREFLFDGYSLKAYMDLLNNPIVQEMAADMGVSVPIPDNMKDGKFAIFKNKNGTADDWYVVHNGKGERGMENVGQLVSVNDQVRMDKWGGDPCNMINGSDGTFFPPFLTKETVHYIFIPNICRSLALVYHSDDEFYGLKTYRFTFNTKDLWGPKHNPDNWCFAPKEVNKTMFETWENDGVFNLAPCFGAPLLLSLPHFLGAEDWIRDSVIGLNPVLEKHSTVIQFHPLTGCPLQCAARMQFAIELIPYPEMPTFSDARHAIIPLAWIEEVAGIEGDKNEVMGMKFLDHLQSGFRYVSSVLAGIGAIMLGVGIMMPKLKKDTSGPKRKVTAQAPESKEPKPPVYP